ncbi:RHS repeat domain-containing protein [Streptomyces sp. SGAir0957]
MSCTFDAAGRPTAESDYDGRVTTYAHGAAGRLVNRCTPTGETIRCGYDAVCRLM